MPSPALLRPLRHRDFALLWTGMTISLLGDGIYLVAIAWQVYDLTSSPAALSLVGLAWSTGLVAFLLLGGAVADRMDRRRVMICADGVRGLCLAGMGGLAVGGVVQVWELVALSGLYGCAEGFFSPAFSALIPQLVPAPVLVQANALQAVVRPAMFRLLGPALGGVLVGAFGAGTAFLVDAGSFALGIGCVALIRTPGRVAAVAGSPAGGIREGLRWARGAPWFWATLAAAAVGIFCTAGPEEVLLPYVVRHELGGDASAYGAVLAAGGVGGIVAGLCVGERGLPRRKIAFMYVAWTIGGAAIAFYAVAGSTWLLGALTAVSGAGFSLGTVVWWTLMQTRVPPAMLGRVTALDWVVSFGLSPLSFAVTGPIAALAGVDATLIAAGAIGALTTMGFLALPALRADDRSAQAGDVLEEPGVGDGGGLHPEDLDALARR